MDTIAFAEFEKIDLRTGKILSAERIEGTAKLVKLQVDTGTEKRQLVAGIADVYEPKKLVGKEIVVVANLEPKVVRGEESKGMLLAAVTADSRPVLLQPEKEVPAGTKVR